MHVFAIIYTLHTLWAFFKGVNYVYSDLSTFLAHLCLGIVFNYTLGINLKGIIKKKTPHTIAITLLSFVLVVLMRYRYRFGASADLGVFFDNFELLFNIEGLDTASGKLKNKDYLIAFAVAIACGAVNFFRFSVLKTKLPILITAPLSLLFIILFPIQNDEALTATRSTYLYFFPKNYQGEHFQNFINKGPRKIEIKSNIQEKPNVFVILLESFSTSYIGEKTTEGTEITPTFNRLIKDYTSIPNYYAPTIQTVKAQYSLLCSKIPLIKGKASYQLDHIKFNCLPKYLRKNGFETLFYKSYQDMTFDNTDLFAKKIGFNHVEAAPINTLSSEQKKKFIWGWGVQDDVSYKMFLDRAQTLAQDKPIFAVMTTVSHHMNFNKVPKHLWKLYQKPKNKTQRFQNSLYLSDLYLQTFISEIKSRGLDKNSIIFITADHSYPSGENGNHNSELGAFEENFKVPMIILGKDKLIPSINKKLTYSHYDLMPTILESVGYNGTIESIGDSMYHKKQNAISPLIQPYNGLKIAFIDYPQKYVWSAMSDRTEKYLLGEKEVLSDIKKNRSSIQKYLDFTYAELKLIRKK